ncbi:hypothetical protein C4553_03735 [Candidatus Parcubacteria bacterium]|nr:MAG: hypothetical protein C4553_03735 [Candidatus Parcubacteria bacterium]
MNVILTTLSILIITFIVWLTNKATAFKICPVCAGVSGTWVLLTAGSLLGIVGKNEFSLLTALLMGGTVVGIAYQSEKSWHWANSNPLLWKILFILPGIILTYILLLNMGWKALILEIALLAVALYLIFIRPTTLINKELNASKDLQRIEELKKKLKNCC